MGFAMRMKLNEEIIKKASFAGTYIGGRKCGFEFDVQLAYYRGQYLSCIEQLEVWLDGEQMPEEAVFFELNGKEMPVYKLKWAMTEFWSQVVPARIRVIRKGGIAAGEHELELKLMLRIPYMQIGPDHTFMPLDAGEKVTVFLEDEPEGVPQTTEELKVDGAKLGATLFCYGTEYARYQYDFEECVRQAYLAGAKGYEIVGTQMIPSYPNVDDEFLGRVAAMKAKYGIGPVGYGANQDKGMRPDRNLTDDEMLADAIVDLKTANRLGCKVMRVQYMMSPAAFERLAPYAELFDVRCGIEIHNPEPPKTDAIRRYIEVIDRTGSKYLGFVTDFGFLATAPNKPKWLKALKAGVKEEHLQLAADMRSAGRTQEETMAKMQEVGANPAIMDVVAGMFGFVQFTNPDELGRLLDELRYILPYTFEIHCKFHYLGDDGLEPSIRYEKILPVVKESGFDGWLICEYEDEMYSGGHDYTQKMFALERSILE